MRKLAISDIEVMRLAVQQEITRSEESRHDHPLHGILLLSQGITGYQVTTPANWKDGEDCIITPAVSDDDKNLFPKGYTAVKPYLRVTPQPNK